MGPKMKECKHLMRKNGFGRLVKCKRKAQVGSYCVEHCLKKIDGRRKALELKVADAILRDLKNSTWGEFFPGPHANLVDYREDIAGTVRRTIEAHYRAVLD